MSGVEKGMEKKENQAGDKAEEIKSQAFKTLRELHLRTWELEFLISGAVIFALLNLPGLMDEMFDSTVLHISRNLFMVPWMLYYFGKLVSYTLIVTFFMHMISRAFWVGLVGLDSVFPSGVKWEKLKFKPIQKEVARETTLNLKKMAGMADKFCSSLFSAAFQVIFALFYGVAAISLCFGIVYLISLAFGGWSMKNIYFIALVAFMATMFAPFLVAAIIDRILEKRETKSEKLAKLARTCYKTYNYISSSIVTAPIFLVFASHLSRKIASIVMFLFLGFVVSIFMVNDVFVRQASFNSYVYFPDDDLASKMDFAHYEDQRRASTSRVPTIQSDVIDGPYLKLFLPWRAWDDNEMMAKICPNIEPFGQDGLRFSSGGDENIAAKADSIAGCFLQLFEISLNNEPLETDSFFFYVHPKTKLRGLIGYVPTEGLPKGRNFLKIERETRQSLAAKLNDDEEEGENDEEPEPREYFIPFWR